LGFFYINICKYRHAIKYFVFLKPASFCKPGLRPIFALFWVSFWGRKERLLLCCKTYGNY